MRRSSGEVTEANPAHRRRSRAINSDPEGEGWFFKLKLSDPAELDGLMDEAAYREWVEDALSRRSRLDQPVECGAIMPASAAFVAELGEAALDLLDPQPGEAILDIGCGDGALTAEDRRARRDRGRDRQFARA